MNIIHLANGQEVHATAQNPHFLMTASGGYVALGDPNHSNYDGYFAKVGSSWMKILGAVSSINPTSLIIDQHDVIRKNDTSEQEFALFDEGLRIRSSDCTLTLDCKKIYDESDQGRMYKTSFSHDGNFSIVDVSYTKYSDPSLTKKEYETFVCLMTTMALQQQLQWRQVNYAYDSWRGTKSTPWVYDLVSLKGNGVIVIAAAESATQAKQQALKLLAKDRPVTDAPALPKLSQLAWRALSSLQTKTGIMAGLPWFFQEWSRDELIACGGLLAAKRYTDVIKILDKWYSAVKDDGTLPAIYPDQGLPSSDAPGWLGKRTRDLLIKLSDEDLLSQLPQEMIERWREKTALIIDRSRSRIKEGLIWNGANTTWMDTSSNDDGRAGARIEIQALFLVLYDAHAHLCTLTKTPVDHTRNEVAQTMIDTVHKRFVVNGKLIDGLHANGAPDLETRPNLFLAWYAAPKLFKNDEWDRFFHASLDELWLEWGGLSSLSRRSNNYRSHYSGEDVGSYHRGDSWYYVNNIAAIAMHEVDAHGFKEQVRAIISASMRDLLSQGYAGHCSELSEAAGQKAAGCHAQAWSASTLLEALQRIDAHDLTE